MSLMSSFKGILGETVINVAMWLKHEKNVYHRLNNITLPRANGGSTQIDHVIVSVYGIFVIETKNYKGWIYGSEKQRQWTQVFPNGSKFKFQNPLRQNYLHIKTLADLLALDISYFHSMIAFIGECELKTRDELPDHVLTGGMVSYVKSKQNKILSEDEVKSIVEQINSNKFDKSWKTNREHRAYLKDKHANISKPAKTREVQQWSGQTQIDSFFSTPFKSIESEPKIKETAIMEVADRVKSLDQTPTCPTCHGEMIERMAKKGARQGQTFYGCSQFPKCRGVVNIE